MTDHPNVCGRIAELACPQDLNALALASRPLRDAAQRALYERWTLTVRNAAGGKTICGAIAFLKHSSSVAQLVKTIVIRGCIDVRHPVVITMPTLSQLLALLPSVRRLDLVDLQMGASQVTDVIHPFEHTHLCELGIFNVGSRHVDLSPYEAVKLVERWDLLEIGPCSAWYSAPTPDISAQRLRVIHGLYNDGQLGLSFDPKEAMLDVVEYEEIGTNLGHAGILAETLRKTQKSLKSLLLKFSCARHDRKFHSLLLQVIPSVMTAPVGHCSTWVECHDALRSCNRLNIVRVDCAYTMTPINVIRTIATPSATEPTCTFTDVDQTHWDILALVLIALPPSVFYLSIQVNNWVAINRFDDPRFLAMPWSTVMDICNGLPRLDVLRLEIRPANRLLPPFAWTSTYMFVLCTQLVRLRHARRTSFLFEVDCRLTI